MDFTKYLEKIQLQETACQSFWELHCRCGNADFEKNLSACYEAYAQGDEAFGAALKTFAEEEGVTPEQINLYVFLRMSEKTLEGYLAKGIGEDVFYESMYSMTVCCQVCYDRLGIYGIDQATYRRWQRYVLDGTLFRLGRLEFQLKVLDEDIEIGTVKVPAGETVISVHIPRYLPLKEEDCEKSYACAREFFRRYYGMETCVFVCHSWLLHPWMQECLPETSAIIRFQKKFKLLRVEQSVASAVSWIFPGYEGKPVSEYPADTSLRRAAIDRINRGLSIGTAFGVRL
mgnify:CR=1 FL=1